MNTSEEGPRLKRQIFKVDEYLAVDKNVTYQ
jgi:hypothetical protein